MDMLTLSWDEDHGWILQELRHGEWEFDPGECFRSCRKAMKHAREVADKRHLVIQYYPRRGSPCIIPPRKAA